MGGVRVGATRENTTELALESEIFVHSNPDQFGMPLLLDACTVHPCYNI